MREIEFRGKKKSTGEWVYGYYLVHIPTDEHKIHYLKQDMGFNTMATAIVYKQTVGQYTSKTDRCGDKIYEGDELESWDGSLRYVVIWRDGGFWMYEKSGVVPVQPLVGTSVWKIIDNIHDK